MKKIVLLVFLISAISLKSQQKLAFSFAESPQTLLLNPGAETNFRSHYGIPMLSDVSFDIGITGFKLNDLFSNDSRTFRTRFEAVLNKINATDYLSFNTKIDVLNIGFRLDKKTYLSFGFYEEIDFISYLPKDFIELFYYGNEPFINRNFSLAQVSMKGDFLGVFHAGISKKISEKLNIGARAKIYSSSINIESLNNFGTFNSSTSTDNIIRQSLNNINGQVRTSGIVDSDDEYVDNPNEYFSRTFLGGNLGLGLDVGLTYHFTSQLEFTASLLDIGFVKHSKNTKNFNIEGDYVLDGLNFEYDTSSLSNYWQQIEQDFRDRVITEETQEAYTSWRPMKINAAFKYSFGERREKSCYSKTHKEYYYNAIGFQIHNIMRPIKPQFSFTSFYEASLSKKVHTKFTHTINDYSAVIFGAATSLQLGKLYVYGGLDNLLGVADVSTANSVAFNFGFNIVID
ncbi:MAG: DUF5723 family protein [Flavobacteriaceae bacterium]